MTKYLSWPAWDHQPLPHHHPATELHTPQVVKKFAENTTMGSVQKDQSAALHMCAGTKVAMGSIPVKGAPRSLHELTRAHSPLRHFQFERELVNHTDKIWVFWLLHSIKYKVALGYDRSRGPMKAKILPTSNQHPEVIDAELAKECAAGCILGPFIEPPLANL